MWQQFFQQPSAQKLKLSYNLNSVLYLTDLGPARLITTDSLLDKSSLIYFKNNSKPNGFILNSTIKYYYTWPQQLTFYMYDTVTVKMPQLRNLKPSFKSNHLLIFILDCVLGLMSWLLIYLIACLIWTSPNALGSCDLVRQTNLLTTCDN